MNVERKENCKETKKKKVVGGETREIQGSESVESEKAGAWKGDEAGFRTGKVEKNAVENTDEGNEGKEKQQKRENKIEAEGGKRRGEKRKRKTEVERLQEQINYKTPYTTVPPIFMD